MNQPAPMRWPGGAPPARAGAGRPDARPFWRHPLARIDFDAVFACWTFLTGLFPLYLKTLTGVSFLLLPVAFVLMRPDRIVPLVKRGWLVLLFPVFAMLSTTWSVLPGVTIYYSTQFAITILCAVIMGVALDRRQMLNGAFAAFFFHVALTFLWGMKTGRLHHDIYEGFVGFAGSKNTTADMGCIGLLVCIASAGAAVFERRPILGVLAAMAILAEAYIVYCALSAGANAAASVAALLLLVMLFSRPLPTVARTSAMVLGLGVVITAAATQKLWYHAVFEGYLRASGKDEGLTGRTYIWSRAEVLFHQHPIIGRGYAAFWQIGDLESEAIWEKMFVGNRMGFNFHNSFWELLVYLGYVGLVLFMAIAVVSIVTLFARTMIRVQPASALFCAFIVYEAMRFPFEAVPLGLFSHNVLLLYAAFAAAFAAVGKPESADYSPRHWLRSPTPVT